MWNFVAAVVLPVTFAAAAVAGDALDGEVLANVKQAIREVEKIDDDGLFETQGQKLRAFDEQYKDNPSARVWLRREIHQAIVDPRQRAEKGVERRLAWLADFDAWVAREKIAGDALARYQAFRLRASPPDVLRAEAPDWMERLARVDWRDFETDYFGCVQFLCRDALDRRDTPAIRERWDNLGQLHERFGRHPQWPAHLNRIMIDAWRRSPAPLPAAEWSGLLRAATERWADMDVADEGAWSLIVPAAASCAAGGGDGELSGLLLDRAAARFADHSWLELARSGHADCEGRAADAAGHRARAAALALVPPRDDYPALVRAVAAEFDAAARDGRWDHALGLARSLFNVARGERYLSQSLSMAGRARLAGGAAGLTAAQSFLGLLAAGDAPAEWRGARPDAEWRAAFADAFAAAAGRSESGAEVAAAWRRRAWAALLTGDVDAGWAAAATAYNLPDFSFSSQRQTLETLGLAARARTGSLLTAGEALRALADGTKPPEGLSPAMPRSAAANVSDASNISNVSNVSNISDVPDSPEVPEVSAVSDDAKGESGRGDADPAAALAELLAAARSQAGFVANTALFLPAVESYAAGLSLSGRGAEMLGVMRALYDGALTDNEFALASAGLSGALRSLDGGLVRANLWLEFQRHGPAGVDGVAGTPDDLADPLSGQVFVAPAEWRDGWNAVAADWESRDAAAARRARLLAGGAAEVARDLIGERRDLPFEEAAWRTHAQWAAATLKALRGHTFAGAEYAAFLRYGPRGVDGESGTPDDLPDPLSAFPAHGPEGDTPRQDPAD